MADAQIVIDEIATERILVPVVGLTPLIINRFPEKAKQQMLDAMQGRKATKSIKDPQAEYEASLYRIKAGGDEYGFPAVGFKGATIGGARFYRGVTMTALRQFVFFRGDVGADGQQLVRIVGTPERREDAVRVKNGGADLRYRAMFPEWSAVLDVVYAKTAITQSSILSLIDAGGMGVGVGEWRPEHNGDFGTYRINQALEIRVVKQ